MKWARSSSKWRNKSLRLNKIDALGNVRAIDIVIWRKPDHFLFAPWLKQLSTRFSRPLRLAAIAPALAAYDCSLVLTRKSREAGRKSREKCEAGSSLAPRGLREVLQIIMTSRANQALAATIKLGRPCACDSRAKPSRRRARR